MGKPSISSSGTSNQTAITNPAAWYTQQFQDIMNSGNLLYGGLAGQTPGLMPDQITASQVMNAGLQNYMMQPQVPAYDVFGMGNQWNTGPFPVSTVGPIGAFNNQAVASQAQAAQMQPAQLAPTDPSQFMSPYIETALNPALNRLRQQQAEVLANVGAQAAAGHAYGGSREAVQEMLADRNYRDTLANTAGNMLSQAYNTAQQAALSNVANRQAAASTNAQLQNTINSLNAQLGTNVSLANMQTGLGYAQLGQNAALQNAQMQNQAQQQYQNLLFQGAQSDAARYLQAVGLQPQIDTNQLNTIMNAANALNQLGANQGAIAGGALGQYWNQLGNLAQLLRAGVPGSTTTTAGTTTGTQTRPFDFGSAALGILGLLGRTSPTSVLGGLFR